MIVVLARMRIKPGCAEKIIALAERAIEATRQEAGCLGYRLLHDPYDECEFCFVETWADKQALEAHRFMEHFLTWREQSADMVIERIIKRYQAEEINV